MRSYNIIEVLLGLRSRDRMDHWLRNIDKWQEENPGEDLPSDMDKLIPILDEGWET